MKKQNYIKQKSIDGFSKITFCSKHLLQLYKNYTIIKSVDVNMYHYFLKKNDSISSTLPVLVA